MAEMGKKLRLLLILLSPLVSTWSDVGANQHDTLVVNRATVLDLKPSNFRGWLRKM